MTSFVYSVAIVNGPNLNLLGKREPHIYGTKTFETYYKELSSQYPNVQFAYMQSNAEGELIDAIQSFGFDKRVDIILNPGAYTHTSVALRDAVAAIPTKVVEVHLSNIFNREIFRSHSYISAKAAGVISGLGLKGYELALLYLLAERKPPKEE